MEVPDDLFMHDVQTMPMEDPAIAAKLRAEIEKANKVQEAAEKKARGRPPGTKNAPKQPASVPASTNGAAASGAAALNRRNIKLQKITLYFAHLGHKIKQKQPKELPKGDQEIDELLASIECELHAAGGIEKASVFVVTGAQAVENLMPHFNPFGWDLSGPQVSFAAAVAANQKKWEDLVKEFAISNAEWFCVSSLFCWCVVLSNRRLVPVSAWWQRGCSCCLR
jgi:hypothetical protein